MRTPKSTLILSCVSFITLGILTSSLGPVLPDLANNTGSTLESMGVVFTALFMGALISQIVSGTMADKIGSRPVLLAGIVLLSSGMFGISIARSLIWVIVFGILAGLGHGAVNMSINLLSAKVFPNRSVAALNLVNFFYGVGAVSGPAIASYFLSTVNTAIPAMWIGCGALLISFPFVLIFLLSPVDADPVGEKSAGNGHLFSPLLWITGLFLFVYVGTENGVGGWTAVYMQRTTTLSLETSTLIVSAFWLALTAGRLFGAVIGTKWTSNKLLAVSITGSLLGGLMMALSTGNQMLSLISILLCGLFFGPIYPTTFSLATSTFTRSSGKAAGIFVAMACLGGMVIPPLQGLLLERYSPNSSVWLVAAGTITMVVLFGFLYQSIRKKSTQSEMELINPIP